MTKIIKILTKIAENQHKTTGLSKETSDSDVSQFTPYIRLMYNSIQQQFGMDELEAQWTV